MSAILAKRIHQAATVSVIVIAFAASSVNAQAACLPADSNAVWLLGNLRAYATDSSGGFAHTTLHLPLLTTAQAESQVVQLTNDSLCAIASQKINESIVMGDPSDNLPNRPVYLFAFSDLYIVRTIRHGLLSQAEIYDANWTYLGAFGWVD
jgi:hypothetical protein